MILVDIATKIIKPDSAMWVVFPGKSRRFLKAFQSQSIVFLETPGLRLPPAQAKDWAAVRQNTRMTLAIIDYLRGNTKRVPSRRPSSYSEEPFKHGRDRVFASSIRKMFGKIQPGDLIVVPGHMYEPVYFGEVTSEYKLADRVTIDRYPNEEIPCRRVRWLNSGVPRNQIPPDLQIYLSKPPAIAAVPRTSYTEQFYNLAYPAFVLAEKSAVIIEGPQYDGKNPLATHEANVLISYFISAFSAMERERIGEFAKLDVESAIQKFYDEELVQSFSQNFNSPGRFGLIALSAAMATFVSAAVAISLKGYGSGDFTNGITVTNSVSPDDAAHAAVAGVKLDYLFKSLHKKEIEKIDHLAKQAKKKIGLKTPVQVETSKP
jgi:hypothetical protein